MMGFFKNMEPYQFTKGVPLATFSQGQPKNLQGDPKSNNPQPQPVGPEIRGQQLPLAAGFSTDLVLCSFLRESSSQLKREAEGISADQGESLG